MKVAVLVGLVALASCSQGSDVGCPALDKLAQRDAAADARAALVKGDRRLLMLGGFVGSVPGGQESTSHPTRMMEGTSDTTPEACRRQRATAEAYAAKYNETITRAD